MMGYEGRALLLDNGEEWVNIPFVVREFMRQLNDEAHASRSLMESLRQEQKEVNLLLRRVMQKQADLEMDNTRTTLTLQRAASTTHDAAQKRQSEQIHYLRKKQERLDERVAIIASDLNHAAEEKAAKLASPSKDTMADEVKALTSQVLSCKAKLSEQEKTLQETQRAIETNLTSSIAAATGDLNAKVNAKVSDLEARMTAVESAVEAHKETIETQKHESRHLRKLCGDFAEVAEKDRETNKERVNTCLQLIDKAEALRAAQQSGIESKLDRLENSLLAEVKVVHDETTATYMELRAAAKSEQHETLLRCDELAEELSRVKQQHKRLQEQLASDEGDNMAQRAMKLHKELSARVGHLESVIEEHATAHVTRSEWLRLQQESQKSAGSASSAQEEARVMLQNQVRQIEQSVKALRSEQGEDNDWLHNELKRLAAVVGYDTQQREKHEKQVTALCDIVHNLSVAVEDLQTARAQSARNDAGLKSSAELATTAPHSVSPTQPAHLPESQNGFAGADANASANMEAWRTQVVKEVEGKISVVAVLQQRCERLTHQLNELTAKVDGGARYAQSVAAQHMDQVRQCVKDEMQKQLQAHAALRELTPALVELEAVKRRIAGVEMDVQSAATREEKRRSNDAEGFSDASVTSHDLQRRLIFVEDSVSGSKRRLLELGEHVMEVEQHGNATARTMHQLELRLTDQERVSAKLGTDLTTALESLLRTEETLAQHQKSMTAEIKDLHKRADQQAAEATEAMQAKAGDVALSTAVSTVQRNLDHLQSEVATLSTTVKQIPATQAAELTPQLQLLRADLEAVRRDSAAAASKHAEEIASCTATVAQEFARMGTEATRVREDVEERVSDCLEELQHFSERLGTVEAAIASAPAPPPPHDAMELSGVTAAIAEVKATAAQAVEQVQGCYRRLDAQSQQISTLAGEASNAATDCVATARREWQTKLGALHDEVMAWVTAHVATQATRTREELRGLIEDAERNAVPCAGTPQQQQQQQQELALEEKVTAAGEEDVCNQVAQLQQRMHDVETNVERQLATIAATQREELGNVLQSVERAHVRGAELRREMHDALVAQQEDHNSVIREVRDTLDELKDRVGVLTDNATPAPDASTPNRQSRTEAIAQQDKDADASALAAAGRGWKEEVLRLVHAEFYTKSLLEERLENIWSSIVSLLSRKEDMAAVNEKLNGLHQLMQEEMQIEMEKLEDQLAGQLAEKVSLTSLQDILEEHFVEPYSAP